MTSVFELNSQEYNLKLAEALKSIPEFKQPEWSLFVKSGTAKERPIDDEDFWYKRSASILRQIYKKGVVGVNRLRTKYGSKKNRGARPEKFFKASGATMVASQPRVWLAGSIQKPFWLHQGSRSRLLENR